MATRGMYTTVTEIRRRVFTEVARLSYEGNDYAKELPRLPYKIVPGEIGLHRNNIFHKIRAESTAPFQYADHLLSAVRAAYPHILPEPLPPRPHLLPAGIAQPAYIAFFVYQRVILRQDGFPYKLQKAGW